MVHKQHTIFSRKHRLISDKLFNTNNYDFNILLSGHSYLLPFIVYPSESSTNLKILSLKTPENHRWLLLDKNLFNI